jgi:hypothetical protein
MLGIRGALELDQQAVLLEDRPRQARADERERAHLGRLRLD